MTQYFLTLPHDSAEEPTMESMQEMDPAELEAVFAAVGAFNTALTESGALVTAGGLQPPSTAITVNASGGDVERVPGPFVEAPEYVGGFGSSTSPTRRPRSAGPRRPPPLCSPASRSAPSRRPRTSNPRCR